jgi:hypothetical protein
MTAIRSIAPWARGFLGRFGRWLPQGQHELQSDADNQNCAED